MIKSKTCVCFSHGKESAPWGTKIKQMSPIAKKLFTGGIRPMRLNEEDKLEGALTEQRRDKELRSRT
ncbi:hypothetical protein KAI46_11615, partial [bacterium]|nr:hypothetical protein [bacterium]